MSIYLRYLAAAAESVSVICWLLSGPFVASEGIVLNYYVSQCMDILFLVEDGTTASLPKLIKLIA
jgi:hypothetical protein